MGMILLNEPIVSRNLSTKLPLKKTPEVMTGILNVDKPSGMTSFQVVALVKRLSGERLVGHAGTLDPIATGVLPVCLGQATRVVEFLSEAKKTYLAKIELGIATDTYDITGQVTQRGDTSAVDRERLELALISFRGVIRQTPPMYSAVKYQGQPLYKLARAGITVERQSRMAHIYSLELIDWQSPVATIEVVCSKCTYVRSIAHDLGQALGCGAALLSLARLKYGGFDIKDALSVSSIEHAFRFGYWPELVHPLDSVLAHWEAVVLGDDAEADMKMGRPLILSGEGIPVTESIHSNAISEKRCRTYTLDGRFVGVLRFNPVSGGWHQKILL